MRVYKEKGTQTINKIVTEHVKFEIRLKNKYYTRNK